MFPPVSSNSTLPELLSVIRLGFEQKECKEAERILIRREENFRNEIKDLSREVENLKAERHLLEKLHKLTETQKDFAVKELQKRKVECEELSERINRLIDEHKLLVEGKIQAELMHRKEIEQVKLAEIKTISELKRKNKELDKEITSLVESKIQADQMHKKQIEEEVKRAEIKCMKTNSELKKKKKEREVEIMSVVEGKIQAKEMHIKELEEVKRAEIKEMAELKRKNKELEEVITVYKDNFERRISKQEEFIIDLLGVSDGTKGNHQNPNSLLNSMKARSSNHSSGNHPSFQQHNQELFAGNSDIDVYERKPVVSSPIAAADGPNNPIVLIDTDDESDAIAKTCDLNLNSSLKEMPTQNRMSYVKTEESDSMKDSSFILLHGRKRRLINLDEDYKPSMSRQKTQDTTEQIFNKGCSNMYGSVALCTVSSDSSYDGTAAANDIDIAFAKIREKAWKSAADLLSEFEKNYELCMKAVCVLYRKTISGKKLTSDPSTPKTPGFSHFVATRGEELAEFLINGDQKHRLGRSVAEVKEKCPEVLEWCREIATLYNEKLFEIYCKSEDPFFCCLTRF